MSDPQHAFDRSTLSTPRLRLRPLRADDADALFSIFSDPVVMRYMNTGPWPSIERAHQMIDRDTASLPKGEYVRFGLEIETTGQMIGICNLFQFMWQCRRCEIGYTLGRAFWGNGYMHEALTALIAFGFEALDLNRIEADVDPRNPGSVRSLERLGFAREGLLRERWIVEGEVSDSGLYGLLRSDWVARGGSGR
jgi:RimJ/RimL family protein N-acetyltransferase